MCQILRESLREDSFARRKHGVGAVPFDDTRNKPPSANAIAAPIIEAPKPGAPKSTGNGAAAILATAFAPAKDDAVAFIPAFVERLFTKLVRLPVAIIPAT